MRLLIVRHAAAVPRGTEGLPDAERPRTERGQKRFELAARGLARLIPVPALILASPLVRARQTADIAAAAWGQAPVTLTEALAGGPLSTLLGRLDAETARPAVALFGHEPQLSELLAHLIGCEEPDAVAFKKGGAAVVEVADPAARGSARLVGLLPPRVLRRLGDVA